MGQYNSTDPPPLTQTSRSPFSKTGRPPPREKRKTAASSSVSPAAMPAVQALAKRRIWIRVLRFEAHRFESRRRVYRLVIHTPLRTSKS